MRSWLLMFLLLLSSLLVHEAQGIRVLKGSVADRQHNIQGILPGKRNNSVGVDEEAVIACKSKHCSGKKKRKLSRVQKETHHWLPRIHEDYYGPRMHRPKHH
ncbi:UNVERIFIED_CONTAM: hypothetical protein Sradi_2030400 [Sesamum radiatum]|uniref:Uncharacterized protein n=1 Tax=Sesamum radiatum TaxID=300843 RepID=A0AAW2TGQ2_SESRA